MSLALLLAAALAPAPADEPAACRVAISFIEDMLSRASGEPGVFSLEPELVDRSDLRGLSWWRTDGKPGRAKPPAALLRRLGAPNGPSAVAACASIRALLDRQDVRYGNEAVEAAVGARDPSVAYSATIIAVDLPVVSRDESEALIVSSSVDGVLAGAGAIYYLRRRPDGRWLTISQTQIWIA